MANILVGRNIVKEDDINVFDFGEARGEAAFPNYLRIATTTCNFQNAKNNLYTVTDGSIVFDIYTSGIHQRYTFTEI